MIRLERFTTKDFDYFVSWVSNEEDLILFAASSLKYPLTKEQLQTYISEETLEPLKIILSETGEVIGHADINRASVTQPKLGRILIGNPALRGKGLGKMILHALLNRCFKCKKVKNVELNVIEGNITAISAYKAVGFKMNPSKNMNFWVGKKEYSSLNMIISREQYFSHK